MGTLYLVATPIGNLEDITLRALRILREARLIAAEDTRHTRRLLDRYAITTPVISYHEHNKQARQAEVLAVLAEGDVALVSDAGTPAINDPGYELVQAAIAAGYPVSPVPGPSAPLAALIASGLPTAQWTYLGYLPARPAERRAFIARYAGLPTTLLILETPHRLLAALRDLEAGLGDRPMCAAREITKLHEEFVRGPISAVRAHFEQHAPRGEFVLVIAGQAAPPPRATGEEWQTRARRRLGELIAGGMSASAAARQVARELGVPRQAVYALWLAQQADATHDL
ncbi:16S rRNA (cytidine(1402)-2'-O)-methyltransferase [Kallotenue papyrolyticum]|uniref:16S rRNA (cytidine(1402)-2'-O)-methyltransferase n=1 Tax=Kallotenue papyrolyticum TaxID=1325125 RepID=UPI0004785C8F|nr:16S rRNA (cytidine(1402)-2'-O)-methyltransferase [Kallotenue papyrolyticum]